MLALNGLSLKLHGAETAFLELPDARVTGVGFDLARRTVDVARIAVKGGHARLRVDENGMLNVQRAARETQAGRSPAAAPHLAARRGKAWKVALKDFDFGGFAVDYEDVSRSPGLKAGIASIGVRLKAEAEAGAGPAAVKVNDIAVALKGLHAGFAGTTETPLRIESVALEGGAYDLGANSLTLSKLAVEGGSVDLRRDADGAVNLALLFAPPADRRHRPGDARRPRPRATPSSSSPRWSR